MLAKRKSSNNSLNLQKCLPNVKDISLASNRLLDSPIKKRRTAESTLKQLKDKRSLIQRTTARFKMSKTNDYIYDLPGLKLKRLIIQKKEKKLPLKEQENSNLIEKKRKRLVIDLTRKDNKNMYYDLLD